MTHGRAAFVITKLLKIEARQKRSHLAMQQKIFHVGRAHAASSNVDNDVVKLRRDCAKLYARQVRKQEGVYLAVQTLLYKTLLAGKLHDDRVHVLARSLVAMPFWTDLFENRKQPIVKAARGDYHVG